MTPLDRFFMRKVLGKKADAVLLSMGISAWNIFYFGGLLRLLFIVFLVLQVIVFLRALPSQSPVMKALETGTVERVELVKASGEANDAKVHIKGKAPVSVHLARETDRVQFLEIVRRLSPSVQLDATPSAAVIS